MHSSNSCSINTKINIENAQYTCTTCKAKRKSLQAPTISNTGRRSGQTNNIHSGRGSASQSTTPSLNTIHVPRRMHGSGSSPSSMNSKCSKSICSIPSHSDLQKQIEKITNSLDELKILCTNNNTAIIFLKQENSRLTDLIYMVQKSTPAAAIPAYSSVHTRTLILSSSTSTTQPDNSIINHSINLNSNNIIYDNINNNSSKNNLNFNNNSNSTNSNTLNNLDINSLSFDNNNSSTDNVITLVNNFEHDSRNSMPIVSLHPLTNINNKNADLIERRELFIPGFMKINNTNNLQCIAFSILKTLIPSLNQSDICGVRLAPSRPTIQDPTSDYSSFIITLKDSDIVQSVMRAKKTINYFSTKDTDLQFLNSEAAIAMPDRKIFINEVLSTAHRIQYISVKETAKDSVSNTSGIAEVTSWLDGGMG